MTAATILVATGCVLGIVILLFPAQTNDVVMWVWRHMRHPRGEVRYDVQGGLSRGGYSGVVRITYPNGEVREHRVPKAETLDGWKKRAAYIAEPLRGRTPPKVVYPYRQVFTYRVGDSDSWSGYVRVSFADDDHVDSAGFSADSMDEWQAKAEVEFDRIIEERFVLIESRV